MDYYYYYFIYWFDFFEKLVDFEAVTEQVSPVVLD